MDNIPEFFKVGSTKNIFDDIMNDCFKYIQKGGRGGMEGGGGTGGGGMGGSGTGGGGGIESIINKIIFSELLFNQFGGKSVKKWTTFSHNGVLFPEPYQAHGVPLIYGDKKEKVYTGSYVTGVAVMHKSIIIPFRRREQAIEVSRMRRG